MGGCSSSSVDGSVGGDGVVGVAGLSGGGEGGAAALFLAVLVRAGGTVVSLHVVADEVAGLQPGGGHGIDDGEGVLVRVVPAPHVEHDCLLGDGGDGDAGLGTCRDQR